MLPNYCTLLFWKASNTVDVIQHTSICFIHSIIGVIEHQMNLHFCEHVLNDFSLFKLLCVEVIRGGTMFEILCRVFVENEAIQVMFGATNPSHRSFYM